MLGQRDKTHVRGSLDARFVPSGARGREDGLTALRRAMALDPLSVRVNMDAGWLLLQAHRFDEAITQARRAQQLEPGLKEADACIARAMLYQGRTAVSAADSADPFLHAAFSALRGQSNDAIVALEQAYTARSPMLVFLNTEPSFDKLHSDVRFRALVEKMRFP
jgi:lipopolysaccharide biosynthesis regulator YciM